MNPTKGFFTRHFRQDTITVHCFACGWSTSGKENETIKQFNNHKAEGCVGQEPEPNTAKGKSMKVTNLVRMVSIGGRTINIAHISHIEPYEGYESPGCTFVMTNGKTITFADLTVDEACDMIEDQVTHAE